LEALMAKRAKPWVVDDRLWELVEPLLPRRERRFRYPGRRRLDDRLVLQGILFVLHTGIGWEHLPQELGFDSGMTAWRRLHEWQEAGVWSRLHRLLVERLQAAGEIDWSRALIDASYVQAKKDGMNDWRDLLGSDAGRCARQRGARGGAGDDRMRVRCASGADHVRSARP
jgi:transposase